MYTLRTYPVPAYGGAGPVTGGPRGPRGGRGNPIILSDDRYGKGLSNLTKLTYSYLLVGDKAENCFRAQTHQPALRRRHQPRECLSLSLAQSAHVTISLSLA